MYICPTCSRQFKNAEDVAKHSLQCWREQNPYHISKPAPRSDDIVNRTMNEDIANFFASFQEEK